MTSLSEFGYLAGGTALALQLGHRKSYDFDIFLTEPIKPRYLNELEKIISKYKYVPIVNTQNEYSVVVDNQFKITLAYYPFELIFPLRQTEIINLASIQDLAADKAYTIGRRGVWRDYVDIWSIISSSFGLSTIINLANKKFENGFNDKLFLEQLVYFDDVEEVQIEFVNHKISTNKIRKDLQNYVSEFITSLSSGK